MKLTSMYLFSNPENFGSNTYSLHRMEVTPVRDEHTTYWLSFV